MTYKLALYCKTHPADFIRAKRLLGSIQKFNRDSIPFFISCEGRFYDNLISILGTDGYTFVADEEFFEPTVEMTGWEHQMYVKLNFFKAVDTHNVLILDSDAFFIKDFFEKDFIAYDNIPYTIIHENKQVAEYETFLKGGKYLESGYTKAVKAYRNVFGGKSEKIYDYGPNPHLWSRKVLEHFTENYLDRNKLRLEHFCLGMKQQFGIHFRETLTYGEYLLAAKPIDIIPCGPFFKVYHWKELYDFEQKNGWVDEEKIKDNYLGIILQSNWT